MPSSQSTEGRRRAPAPAPQTAMWLVLALVVIGAALLAGFLVFGTGGGSGPAAEPSITPLTSAPASPSTPAGTEPSDPGSTGPTAAGMSVFLAGYLRDVTDDPATAWGNLTPGFQRSSGGFAAYRSFWAPITAARTSAVQADPASRTISYDVRYTYADGRTTTDSTRLTLSFENGTYRISGEG